MHERIPMKRIVFFISVCALVLSCAPQANRLEIDFPAVIQQHPTYLEWAQTGIDNINELAAECAAMDKRADQFRDVDFDALSDKKQVALVKLDLDYAQNWLDHVSVNICQEEELFRFSRDTSMTLELLQATQDVQSRINAFLESLRDQYGEDLRLDKQAPYYQQQLP